MMPGPPGVCNRFRCPRVNPVSNRVAGLSVGQGVGSVDGLSYSRLVTCGPRLLVKCGRERHREAGAAGAALALAAAFVLCLVADPVRADVLVLKGGARVQTRGAWKVVGAQVVFTDAAGTLASLPLQSVDLAASRAAIAAPPARSAPARVRTPPPARLVITDADVGHLAPGELAGAALPSVAGATPTPTPTGPPRVTLYSASWCPWCRKARELLGRLGVPYQERDIDKDPGARADLTAKAGPGAGIPVIVIGTTVVPGYDPARIEGLLSPWARR
jgi:glutaredoxin 3